MTDDVLDLDTIERLLTLSLPPVTTAKAGWKLDRNAISHAVGVLKLERTVKLRFTSAERNVGGHAIKIDFDKDPAVYYHGITLSQVRSFEDANKTFWHELRHCWQAEQVADKTGKALTFFNTVYKNASGPHGESYKQNKFELDARAFASKQVAEGLYLLIPKVVKSIEQQVEELADLEQFVADNAHPEWED